MDVVTSELPGIAQARALYEIYSGVDQVHGDQLGGFDRAARLLDLIPSVGNDARRLLGFANDANDATKAAKKVDFSQPAVSKVKDVEAPEGIVYRRTDLNGEIKPYVGQSKNDSRFLARQKEHARKHPDAEFKFDEIARADPGDALDIAEHKALQELTGGQRAKNSPLVSNLKDPVGPNRRPGFGLPEPRE